MVSIIGAYECIRQFSETDFTKDLERIDVPVLLIHGDADQIVPIEASALAAVKLIPRAELKVYAGAPHGLCSTLPDKVNEDLLAFLNSKK